MKNNKRNRIALIVVIGFMLCSPVIAAPNSTSYNNMSFISKLCKVPSSLKVGNYSISYGTYKGHNLEYEWDYKTEKIVEASNNEIIVKLNPNNTYELDGKKYKFVVQDSNLVVPKFNNVQMFKVIGNNKILLQAGGGVELTYSCK